MDRFEELTSFAGKVGIRNEVTHLRDRAQALLDREHTGLIITGGKNSGKTTVLNGIVGTTLREPDLLSEEGKPLRVTFEKTECSPLFENRIVANKKWYDEDAVLYEVKLTDIMDRAYRPNELLDLADAVVYVVSALSPFTNEDVNGILALSRMPVRVLVSKLDQIEEGQKAKLIAYVGRICGNMNLGEPLLLDDPDWEETAKQLRDWLPVVTDRHAQRKARVGLLAKDAAALIEGKAAQKLQELQDQMEARLAVDEERTLWRKLCVDLKERGLRQKQETTASIMDHAKEFTRRLLEPGVEAHYAGSWENQVPARMREMLKQLGSGVCDRIGAEAAQDIRSILERAAYLELQTEFSAVAFAERLGSQHNGIVDPMDDMPGIEKEKHAGNKAYLLYGGIAAGAMFVLPLSAYASTFGAVAAAAVGTAMYVKDCGTSRQQAWEKAISSYVTCNLEALSEFFEQQIERYYWNAAAELSRCAVYPDAAGKNQDVPSGEAKALQQILERCRSWN